jgi:5-methylcytosine-specific restriction protein A
MAHRLKTLQPRVKPLQTRQLGTVAVSERRERGRPWRRAREQALQRDCGLCVRCQSLGLVTLASEVDHIVPVQFGGAELELSNLRSLCHDCHQAVSKEQGLRG